MDIQEASNTMARSMPIVEAVFPEILPRKTIKPITIAAERGDRHLEHIDSNMALQHTRECIDFLFCRSAEVHRTCHVGSAVAVLAARVAKIDCVRLPTA